MANVKEYAFYIEGTKLSIVERDTQFDNDVNSRDYGPGVHRSQWKSPKSSVTDGLQLLYTHTHDYYLGEAELTPQVNQFYLNGWTVINGYLAFVRSHEATVPDWNSSSPYTAVGFDEYIVIEGSSRWNGLHKTRTSSTFAADGIIWTNTKVNKAVASVTGSSNINIDAESGGTARIKANDASDKWLNSIFSAGDYIFIRNSGSAKNNGMWLVDSVASDASVESDSGIYISNRYFCYDSDNTLSTEGVDTTVDTGAQTNESVAIHKVYRDFCYLLSDIDALNDEADEIPLPSYLEKALVYYVKAKLAEDAGEFDKKEYFMREYKKITEKYESSLKAGARMIATPGPYAIR